MVFFFNKYSLCNQFYGVQKEITQILVRITAH